MSSELRGHGEGDPHLDIDLAAQRLRLAAGTRVLYECLVSTAANGAGEVAGSECTPCGWHVIREKIGEGCAPNTVFVGREASGEIYSPALAECSPGRDWILTRILWLGGVEPGRNAGGEVDTAQRYIYLHGCPDGTLLGVPGSHGCIRLSNDDIVALFDRVSVGTRVHIHE